MIVEVGMTGSAETLVERADTAQEVGSGSLLVYATPCMVALMEGAACNALEGKLAEGETSVGTRMDVKHLSATPVGMEVRAESVLTAVDGRKLTFAVRAFDQAGPIGGGVHERFIITNDRFLAKARKRGEV